MRIELIDARGSYAVYAHTETLAEVRHRLSDIRIAAESVEYLSINNNAFIDDADFGNVAAFVNLRHLMMEGCCHVSTLEPLRRARHLRTLDIAHCFGILTLEPISAPLRTLMGSGLHKMGVGSCVFALTHLHCHGTHDVSFVSAFKDTLQELHIFSVGGLGEGCKKIDFSPLPHLRALSKLVIDAEDVIVDDALRIAKGIPSMRELYVWGIRRCEQGRAHKMLAIARRPEGSSSSGSSEWQELTSTTANVRSACKCARRPPLVPIPV
jgi:hypothetical protein